MSIHDNNAAIPRDGEYKKPLAQRDMKSRMDALAIERAFAGAVREAMAKCDGCGKETTKDTLTNTGGGFLSCEDCIKE